MTIASDLRERLPASLGDAYVIERELGGGGMSRVWRSFRRISRPKTTGCSRTRTPERGW